MSADSAQDQRRPGRRGIGDRVLARLVEPNWLRIPEAIGEAIPRRPIAIGRASTQLAMATALYLLTAAVLTWPLVLHLGSSIYLSPHRPFGDYTGIIANLRALVDSGHNPFLPGRIHAFNAPAGVPIPWVLNLANVLRTSLLYVLTLGFGAIAAFNLFLLLGFVGSGMAMFGFMRRLVDGMAIPLLLGWAMAFYPYAVANGEHPDFVHTWPLVLMVWAALRAIEQPGVWRGAVAGAGAVVGVSWTPYYLLLGGIAFATIVVVALVVGWRRKLLRTTGLTFAIACAILGSYLAVIVWLAGVAPDASGQRPNFLLDVILNSARPANYLLAPAWNPILGGLTSQHLVPRGWDNTEKTLYLGVSLLLLALIALVAAIRRRVPPRLRRATLVAGAITVIAAACSGPPLLTLGRHRLLKLPSWYLFHLTSGFRIYERLVVVVELGVCVLAGIGLSVLLARRRRSRRLYAAVLLVVVLDLWAPIPDHYRPLVVPGVYARLRQQPPGTYADYPLRNAEQEADYRDLFFQAYAGRPTLNGYPPFSEYQSRALALSQLSDPTVGRRLAALGVRYVVLQRHPLPPPPGVPFHDPGRPGRGFVELANDSYGTLYRNDNLPG